MKIHVLDSRHYLAILTAREARSLGLSPDTGKPWVTLTLRDRLAAAHIFSEISRRYHIPIKKDRIFLRFSPYPLWRNPPPFFPATSKAPHASSCTARPLGRV